MSGRGVATWIVDQERQRLTLHRRTAGWLDAVVGAFALMALATIRAARPDLRSDAWGPLLVGVGWIVLHGAAGLLGLVLQQRWSRVPLWITSTLLLPALPLGTALGAYNLWVLYNTRLVASKSA